MCAAFFSLCHSNVCCDTCGNVFFVDFFSWAQISRTTNKWNGNQSMRSIVIASFIGDDDELDSIVSIRVFVRDVSLYSIGSLRKNCVITLCHHMTLCHSCYVIEVYKKHLLKKRERCCWHLLNLSSYRIIIKQIFTCESVSLPVPEQRYQWPYELNSIQFHSIRFELLELFLLHKLINDTTYNVACPVRTNDDDFELTIMAFHSQV